MHIHTQQQRRRGHEFERSKWRDIGRVGGKKKKENDVITINF